MNKLKFRQLRNMSLTPKLIDAMLTCLTKPELRLLVRAAQVKIDDKRYGERVV